jgi:hypothetical protein
MRNTKPKEDYVPDTYWLCFDLTNSDGRLPRSIGFNDLMGINLGSNKLDTSVFRISLPHALAAFTKMIDSLGGLESIKPGESMKLGTMGEFTVNLYRIRSV